MQVSILSFFFIVFSDIGIFQEPVHETQIDSAKIYYEKAGKALFEDFSGTIINLKKAEAFLDKSAPKKLKADIAHRYGVAYYVRGDYKNSLAYFKKANIYYDDIEDWRGAALSLNGQGLIQQAIGRHTQAIEYFKEASKFFKKGKNQENYEMPILNIGISQLQSGKLKMAERSLDSALTISTREFHFHNRHIALNQLGELSYFEKDFKKAIHYHSQVLNDNKKSSTWEKAFANFGIARAYFEMGDLKKAEEFGKLASKYAVDSESIYELERISFLLSKIYSEKKEYKIALNLLNENRVYKDSLTNLKKFQELGLLELQDKEADNIKLKTQNKEAQEQLSKDRFVIFLLIFNGLALATIIFWLVRVTRQKKKINREFLNKNDVISNQNKELDQLNKSKDRLFSILSHDLKSPIGSIQKLLELIKSGEFTQKEQAELLDEMLKQVSATSSMLQNLLQWANSQLEGAKVYIEEVVLYHRVREIMEAHYLVAKSKNIQIIHEVPESLSSIFVDKGHLSIILHNLISNAIKFTHPGKEIKIHYTEDDKWVHLKIKDGGDGVSAERIEQIQNFNTQIMSELGTEMETGTGIGLLLVKQFLTINNAHLQIKSYLGKGSEFIVCFRKNKDLFLQN